MERRLVKHGPSSMIIALPAQWIRDQKLVPGDTVKVHPDGDKLLITTNAPPKRSEITLQLDGLDRTSIMFIIRSAYRQGYTRIGVRFNQKHTTHFRKGQDVSIATVVHQEVQRLIGVEITDQRDGLIVIQEITAPTAQELQNLYRKAFTMVHQLIIQIGETPTDVDIGVEERHDVITKIISYAIRIIAIGEANLSNNERIRMTHTLSLLDIMVDVLKYYNRDNNETRRAFVQELAAAFSDIEKLVFGKQSSAMQSFQQHKEKLRQNPVDRLLPIVELLSDIVILYAVL